MANIEKTIKAAAPAKKPGAAAATVQPDQPARPKPKPVAKRHIAYVDSCMFLPLSSTAGYADDYQGGRYGTSEGGELQAPLLLPVGAKIRSLTIYFKNTSTSEIQVNIVRKHIHHWADTEEFLVSYESLMPGGGTAPDFFDERLINHFASARIADKYLYYVLISNTGIHGSEIKTVRGMRVDYSY